jgi:membrane protease YdiL (CAAX protease family)
MRNIRLGASLIGFSIFALLLLRYVPELWSDDQHFANSTFSYVVLGLVFYVAVYFLGLPSLEYFRLPRIHYKTLVAVLVALTFVSLEFRGSEELQVKGWVAVGGVAFLLAIGFGEEMVSRAFTFGILHKFGDLIAISISSIFFGLMHLNRYLGADWDPWEAYWHVVSAAAFGVFACSLMIVTRSIWLAVIFHGLSDWSIVFAAQPESSSGRQDWGVSFWEGFTLPLGSAGLYIGSALVLLTLNRGSVPIWIYRLALRWKLVKPVYEITA